MIRDCQQRIEMVKLKIQGLTYRQIGAAFSVSGARIWELIHLPVWFHQIMKDYGVKELKDLDNPHAIEAHEIVQQAMR